MAAQPFFSKRVAWVVVLFLAVAIVFFGRLLYLQLIVAGDYSAMAEESRTVSFETSARRGTIYDRNGIVLATSVEATTIYANPAEVTDPHAEAEALASVLGGTMEEYLKKLTTSNTTFVYLKRQIDVALADKVKALDLDGVYFIADTRREYPNGSVGGQVIGFCNVDGEGITGLELQYDSILKGTPGTYSAERGENGMPIPGGVKQETPAVDGKDIMVSLDIKLQDTVEQSLAEGIKPLAAEGGNAVVMDSQTGEIYAICSLPYMDPSHMDESEVGSDQVKAITQAYEPGSIFKTVATASILENNVLTPDSVISCPAVLYADEYAITDSHERGDADFTLREILAQSSNVGISLAVESEGFDRLYASLLKYHLDEKTGVDYPGEAGSTIQDFNTWARVTGCNVSFGQGISVTPLQMTRFYAAIANDGVQVTPHFLISLPQTGARPTYESTTIIDEQDDVDTLVSMLRSVVTDGTGTAADIEGFDVVGKTSTAEIADAGIYKDGVYNLAFTGFLAHSSSPLVCFVGATEVPSQSQVTQIFQDIMSNAIEQYNITPE